MNVGNLGIKPGIPHLVLGQHWTNRCLLPPAHPPGCLVHCQATNAYERSGRFRLHSPLFPFLSFPPHNRMEWDLLSFLDLFPLFQSLPSLSFAAAAFTTITFMTDNTGALLTTGTVCLTTTEWLRNSGVPGLVLVFSHETKSERYEQ
jgi:hypothetical protein